MKFLVIALTLLLWPKTGFGTDSDGAPNTPKPTDSRGFILPLITAVDGSSTALRYRNLHKPDGTISKDQFQYRLDLRVTLTFLKDGSLKLKARAMTGQGYDGSWNETGLRPENAQLNSDFNLRNFYLEYTPSKAWTFQAGALNNSPSNINAGGVLALDGDGWIDGARASYTDPQLWADAISVVVGQIDEYGNTSFFDRNFDGGANFIQIDIHGSLNRYTSLVAEMTQFDGVEYIRAIIELTTRDVVKFIDKVVVEEMLATGSKTHQGFALTVKKAFKSWQFTTEYSYKSDQISGMSPSKLPLEDLYRAGHQITIGADKKMGKDGSLGTMFVRYGKTLNGTDLFNSQGARFDFGYKIGLSRKKKKP
ncbi:MAG: hypothetical protein IT289_11525 [Oligoflexia bacterium]|nr:hypothetical protein [Oligoflexia bacterium]